MKQEHIALIVLPTQEILAMPNLSEPSEPMHSGYTDEERRIMNSYHAEWKKYREDVQCAIPCNQEMALRLLDEQHPNRPTLKPIPLHFNVTGVTFIELCGEEAVRNYKGPKVILKEIADLDEEAWYGR